MVWVLTTVLYLSAVLVIGTVLRWLIWRDDPLPRGCSCDEWNTHRRDDWIPAPPDEGVSTPLNVHIDLSRDSEQDVAATLARWQAGQL